MSLKNDSVTSEKSLAERFNEILEELRLLCMPHFNQSLDSWNYQNAAVRENFYRSAREKIAELESLGIEKVKLEETIRRILQKVEEDIRKVLTSVQLTETERKVKIQIDDMKRVISIGREPHRLMENNAALVNLEVSEQDLIKARERLMRVMEQLVKAAERLD